MNISELSGSLENISLPSEQKKAILQLIDAKINNDMKEVIAEIKQLENKIQMTQDKIQIVNWVVGIAMAIMLFIAAKK
ncbi:MAG: hypothetical protein JST68_22880 [Bacteroidetes bacterium]|nr:hypothetical protein [Bacteroidota bacterium]